MSKDLTKMIVYLCFIVVVVSLVIATNSKPNEVRYDGKEEVTESKTLNDKENIIINGNYSYEFIVGDNSIVYRGSKNGNVNIGVKISSDEVAYKIIDGTPYKMEDDDVIYEEMYDGLNDAYFNFKNLFDKLNSSSTIIKREGEYIRYNYDINDVKMVVVTTKDNISEIVVYDDLTYIFKFSY